MLSALSRVALSLAFALIGGCMAWSIYFEFFLYPRRKAVPIPVKPKRRAR